MRLKRIILFLTAAALALAVQIGRVIRPPVPESLPPNMVNDVSRLNPIAVERVITPTTPEEIAETVKNHAGPISIGGARHSMGGQIAAPGALHMDMRSFNRILAFSPDDKTITVQAGTRWRQIQERIDPANLSVSIMQTYANFTVGGSLSVNAHGRYVGLGPIIRSVKSMKVVLADGSAVDTSPDSDPELFYGVIGGYGGLGIITEATLELTDNVKVKRIDRRLPISEYLRYFEAEIRGSSSAVFHNADIYPNAYDTIHAVTYAATDEPVTVPARLIPVDRSYALNRFLYWMVSSWPGGKAFRQYVLDPILFRGQPVAWRNYEASYDAAELEPASRESSTYVLQEYFVPVPGFDGFAATMRDILMRHRVNVINVSIRYATRDPGSLLAWARTDVFAFVLYYKQSTRAPAQEEIGVWTRELIDAALAAGGSYYLPYQPHAREDQFLRAYPRAREFFALKQRVDPANKFQNELWRKYYHPRGN